MPDGSAHPEAETSVVDAVLARIGNEDQRLGPSLRFADCDLCVCPLTCANFERCVRLPDSAGA